MAEQGRIVHESMDGVALLTFAGADTHNALNEAMWRALDACVRRCEEDDAVRVLVLTGAGHVAFATDLDPEQDEASKAARHTCVRLAGCAKPIIARIRGDCFGAGLVVALHADIRIAAADFDFALAGDRARALGAEHRLLRAVGDTAARFLLLTGTRIGANEALRVGLVTRVVPDADLSDTVADFARLLADQPDGAPEAVKQALSRALSRPGGDAGAGDDQHGGG